MSTQSRIESFGKKRNLTPAEAGEFLGCSRKLVYRLIEEGALPAFMLRDGVKGALRIPRVSLERYELQQAQKKAEANGFSLAIARDCPGFLAPE